MTPNIIHWSHTDQIGQFQILPLSQNVNYIPENIDTQLMGKMINLIEETNNVLIWDSLTQRLPKHLNNLQSSCLPIS